MLDLFSIFVLKLPHDLHTSSDGGKEMSKYHVGHKTLQQLSAAFGFDVEVLGSKTFQAHGERRAIYSVKRPNGKKTYRGVIAVKVRDELFGDAP